MRTSSQTSASSELHKAEEATSNRHPGRRHILASAGAGLVAAAALGGTASAAPSASPSKSLFAGGWLATRHDGSTAVPIRSVFTFSSGGAAVGLDLEPTAPPYLGSWEAHDTNRIAFTFWTPFTDDQGVAVGTARVKAVGHVDGDHLSGSYTVVVYLPGQRVHDSGTFDGVRIDPN